MKKSALGWIVAVIVMFGVFLALMNQNAILCVANGAAKYCGTH